jgi:hypothetical protein
LQRSTLYNFDKVTFWHVTVSPNSAPWRSAPLYSARCDSCRWRSTVKTLSYLGVQLTYIANYRCFVYPWLIN